MGDSYSHEPMKYRLIWASIFAVLSAHANAENLRVHLLAEATVQAETLRLSDLLPPDVGTRLEADKVSLGRAPQAGSLRVFTARELRPAVGEVFTGTTEIDIPQQVVVRRLGWPLETETVRRTLSRSKLTDSVDFTQARIMLPPGFTTVTPHPEFEVTALKPGAGDLGWLAQIRCRERAACGSFLVEIVFSVPAGDLRSHELEPVSEKAATPSRFSIAGPVLVQPGRLALLVMDGDGFRITQPVMPRTPARLGEMVWVFDPLTHRSRVAQVSGDRMLRLSGATRKEETK